MKEEVLIKFGNHVRELRLSQKISQEALAEKSGLHRNYIGMIERGERNPSLINMEKIAISLDTTLTEIFKF